MSERREPTLRETEEFLKNRGKRGVETIKALAKLQPFVSAMRSPIGSEILKDDVNRQEELLSKIWNETATDQEKAEFRYLKQRLEKISKRLEEYILKGQEVSGK